MTDHAVAAETERSEMDINPPPPASTEAWLSALWRQLLQVDDVPLDRDFLELGGQSITVMQMIEETDRQWGVGLDVTEILDCGTVLRLAELIDGRLAARGMN